MDKQLLDAAHGGDLALVELALRNGANVEVTDNRTRGTRGIYCRTRGTPLHWACLKGHLAVVKYLLTSHGANLEATENDGDTPLHLACEWGHLDVVQELVAHGANLEATDDAGKTPLHLAASAGNVAIVQELVDRGADLFTAADNGRTAFNMGADGFQRPSNVVDYLLRAYVEKVTASEGSQAIHAILQATTFLPFLTHPVQLPFGKLRLDHFQTLLQLFPANTFHSRRDHSDGALPLHIACQVGFPVKILRLFVQAFAAALQTADNNGNLPLHAACQADAPKLESIRFVVEQDPNAVQAANNDGALPLHLLCGSRPSVQTVKYLLGLYEGALEVLTSAGDLPFMLACKASSSRSVLQVLLTAYPEALVYMQEYYSRR